MVCGQREIEKISFSITRWCLEHINKKVFVFVMDLNPDHMGGI